jgi:hypothetical protein
MHTIELKVHMSVKTTVEWFEILFYSIIGIQILIAVFIATYTNRTLAPISRFLRQRGDDDAVIYYNVMAIGVLLWPMLWYITIGFDALKECPTLFIAFLWPIVLGIFQLVDIYYDKHEDVQDSQQQRITLIGSIHSDGAAIVSFAFAIGSLYWSVSRTTGDHINLIPSVRIIIVSLLVCIATIVPLSHFANNNQRYSTVARVAQRVFVNYAVGFIIGALIIILAHCFIKKNHRGND